jgi:hypothetical protein
MKELRVALMGLGVVLLLTLAGFLCFVLPQHRVVHISGNEVKRVDMNGHVVTASTAAQGTRDVFFINTVDVVGSDVHVFRNEDTRFSFPWYFKFDSAEVLARAQELQRNNNQLALVTYYGWRIRMLDEYPNAVNIEVWQSSETPFPVFNTAFFVVLALIVLVAWWKVRKFRQRRAAKKIAS